MYNLLFIGDSNVYIFNYFRKFGAKIVKFKGAPIKGLVNKNDNYRALISNIKRFKPDHIFLIFGVVDLNFYYYFKKYKENKKNIFEDIKTYVKDYVKMVSELDVKNKYILGILPSPIKDKYFRDTLVGYGILTEEEVKNVTDDDIMMVNRNKRIEQINNILKTECEKYNINLCDIFPFTTKKYKLRKLFSLGTYSRLNIHHRYEYLLIIFINSCLSFLTKDKDMNIIINDLEKIFNDYISDRIYDKEELTKEEKDKLYEKTKFDKEKIINFIKKKIIL